MGNKEIKSIYDKLMSDDDCKISEKECLYSDEIKIEGKKHVAYVKYLEEPIEIESVMNAFEK